MDTARRKRIVTVIPVRGRIAVTTETVLRLKRQDYPLDSIILIGKSKREREVAEATGSVFVSHPNEPLGTKWQAGVLKARELDADAVLIMGTDDWISDNWCGRMIREIEGGADLAGPGNLFLLHIGLSLRKLVRLHPHEFSAGKIQPFGVGRMYSRRFLDSIRWQLYPDWNVGLDGATFIRTVENGGRITILEDDALVAMDIKSSFWRNKSPFSQLPLYRGRVDWVDDVDKWLEQNFPGSVEFFDTLSEQALYSLLRAMPDPWGKV